MMTAMAERPKPTEHAESFARYIAQVPDGEVLDTMREQTQEMLALLSGLDESKALHRYAPGKWSIKEVVGHVIDMERVFAYRALRFARADQAALPGVEQDDYVAAANFDVRPVASLIEEYRALRTANLALFESFDDATLRRQGTASNNPSTVRALIWSIAGHERHHLKGLRQNYL